MPIRVPQLAAQTHRHAQLQTAQLQCLAMQVQQRDGASQLVAVMLA
jgi:hypothetical protein